MRTFENKILTSASIILATAVMIGAFGAHGLEGKLTLKQMNTFETGVTYHFYHGFALFFLGLAYKYSPKLNVKNSFNCFFVGILLFSGNCYLYAITSVKTFALIIPFGGTLFIIGWILLAYQFFKETK